ncbi:hypothetical protein IAQ61_004774 [Plenodomus lingam]|uniref:Uncharacterized protein n=1 Tax=Leptosphaeria maculans (strain JN3 / isolate v23.1.3 / race Av1-4-5-6-7-8) TaxID=985895 RepID=E4ZWH3_LEPMJ|nr:hypothetical protein LEMA_P031010.1 [Plenodomus lingam JN3]KAH9874145.1 hypothetical protein IAQ61_004774 [Plenodomus lingam]CBX95949.1 hypothetical protein LEMA_P031010.1 [Plenodomus lingam JN3]
MHKLSRTPLASLICPSAPFLAPRLLQTTVPVATATAPLLQTSPRASYATIARGNRADGKSISRKGNSLGMYSRTAERSKKKTLAQSFDHLLAQLREACEVRNVQQVMDLYPMLLEAGVLNAYDTRRIAQTLHVRTRMATDNKIRAELFTFAQKVVADLRSGALKPHHSAYVHFFGIFKDCKRFEEGHELWQWLVDQDERHVSAGAYGAAIELLAYGRLMLLPELESLYLDGLKRFPGTFAQYHLAPDAIVPDRTQPTTIAGIPMILLQGILTARILARDWRNAYLALDTALRLYPSQVPPRYFELFMAERPLSEAYSAYMLACRAGIVISPTHVTALLAKMRAAIEASRSMADRMMLVRATANALYASIEAGGQLQSIHVGILIQAMTQLLPDTIERGLTDKEAPLRDSIVAAVHDIMSGLMSAGMTPQIHPFDALITLSGKLRVPSLLTSTLQDLKAANMELGPVATRDAISAAGLLGNTEVIEELWERIVTKAETDSSGIGFGDWITLTKACRRANHKEYFWAQLARLPHAIEQGVENHIKQQIDQENTVTDTVSFDYMTVEQFSSELDALKSQMVNIEAVLMSGQPLDLLKTPFYMHLNPEHVSLASTENMRTVYDQYSTDPHQPPPATLDEASGTSVPKSPTGIPLDELRFQNWVTILNMMSDAEAYDLDLQSTINAAIKAGKPLTGYPEILRLRQGPEVQYTTIIGLRTRIATLRASQPVDVPRFRYTVSDSPKNSIDAPMAYDPSRNKWRIRSGRLVKYTHPPAEERLQPVQEGALKVPKLSYYLGMESSHERSTGKPRSVSQFRKVNLNKQGVEDQAPARSSDEQNTSGGAAAATHTSPS